MSSSRSSVAAWSPSTPPVPRDGASLRWIPAVTRAFSDVRSREPGTGPPSPKKRAGVTRPGSHGWTSCVVDGCTPCGQNRSGLRFAGIRDGVEWTLRVVSTEDEETFRNTTLIWASESVRADRVLAVVGNDIDTSTSKWSWLDGSRREIAAMTSPDTIRFDGRKRLHVPGEQQTHVDQASASSSLPSPAYPRVTQGQAGSAASPIWVAAHLHSRQ